jgi:hypothetical protein
MGKEASEAAFDRVACRPAHLGLPPCSWSGACLATAHRWGCSSMPVRVAAAHACNCHRYRASLAAPCPPLPRLGQDHAPPAAPLLSATTACSAGTCMALLYSCPAAHMHCRWSAAGLQSEPARVAELRQFIDYAASLDDVWFVTNQQVCIVYLWWQRKWLRGAALGENGWGTSMAPAPAVLQLIRGRPDTHMSTACVPVLPSPPSRTPAAACVDGEPSACQPRGSAAQV